VPVPRLSTSIRLRAERSRQRQLVLDAIVLGAIGAFAAWVFNLAVRLASWLFLDVIAGYHAPGLPSEGGTTVETIGRTGLWLLPVSMALGGLIVGIIVERFAPEAEGHGTDSVIKAFHRDGGVMKTRVPPVKLLASAITIGSGGAAGREGPVAMVTAGIGSVYARWFKRSERDRRILLLVGMAAGLSASFRSPIGTALMSIEVLYSDMEFEASALLYAMLAAVISYAINGFVVGWEPLFRLTSPVTSLARPLDYLWYVILGVAAGLLATVVPIAFYRTRDLFRAMRIHPVLKPALGGLLAGLIALAFPQVISGGYGWMQLAMDGRLGLWLLLALALAKVLAMSLTVGSGGSGGVFAPVLYVGAMLGGACATVAHLPAAPFVIVGMAAVFAGAGRVPMATMMMVTEMTGGYTLLVPAALAVMLSYLIQTVMSQRLKYRTVYEAQVETRGDSPAHHARHLEVALNLLRRKTTPDFAGLGEVDLVSLLRSGIPVELPGDRRMLIGVLRTGSPIAGRTIADVVPTLASGTVNIVAVMRTDRIVAPRAGTTLQSGDRIVIIADNAVAEQLREHFDIGG
jgi:chloride channel protein, CIC family